METLISTVVLISIPSFFAVRHFNEYGTFDNPKIWGRAEKIASLLFALYLGMILVLGKSGIYSFYEPVSTIRDPRFMFFYLFPKHWLRYCYVSTCSSRVQSKLLAYVAI
ncbi:hypothetical protein [Alteromonas sp. KC14]|uniref:hypothetical protein n=1 Tax=Alteromonas sp. KC14 TaxID=2795689 RepID=UPI0019235EE8|nr:hypothetical protein [Alteromonas sp. KC14]